MFCFRLGFYPAFLLTLTMKCRECKKVFNPQRPLQVVCSLECAKLQANKKANKEWHSRKKTIKASLKTVSDYRKDARYHFQRWIRIRDLNKTCISCDKLLTDIRDFDAGHYYSANAYPQLLFNIFNINGQCVYCNQHLSGNLIGYRKGLIKRYGMELLNELDLIAEDKTKRVLTKEYYIEIAEKYKVLIKNDT